MESSCNSVLLLSYICLSFQIWVLKPANKAMKWVRFSRVIYIYFYNTIESCVLERKDPLHLNSVATLPCDLLSSKLLKQCLYFSKFLSSNSYFLLEN